MRSLSNDQVYGSKWLVALGWPRIKVAQEIGIHRMSVGKHTADISIGCFGYFQCVRCERVLPIESMPNYKGNGAKCFDCRKKYYKMDALRTKKQVLSHYGGRCFCCGEQRVGFLTIDHINNDGSRDYRKRKAARGYRWVIIAGFPVDLRVACYNCNCGRYYNGGICPHREGGEA